MRYGQKLKLHFISDESRLLTKRPPMPPWRRPTKSFGPNGKHHRGDASPCRNAAIVAAVTRNAWNGSPTYDAFRRIDRSDARSSVRDTPDCLFVPLLAACA